MTIMALKKEKRKGGTIKQWNTNTSKEKSVAKGRGSSGASRASTL